VRPAKPLLFLIFACACHAPSAPSTSSVVLEPSPGHPSRPSLAADPSGVAVVELFTSEGCSSCPKADVLLADIAHEADPRVDTLAFHVDYWDSLGWRDRFASPAFTERQREYAASFGENGVYTPEMIVNGTEAFTGSDAARARAAIARAVAAPPSARLTLSAASADASSARVTYRVEGAPAAAVLDVALVEGGLASKVTAGENAGRTLRHDSVVRAFAVRALGEGQGTFALTAGRGPPIVWDDAAVVAYVQVPTAQGQGEPILAAARAELDHVRSER
jgi:hypothetical protein